MVSKQILAISTIIGTVIGAGILGIPYVTMKAGFLIGTVHLILLGIIVCLVSLYLSEIVLRTKSDHQLTGYASKYLGKKGKWIMIIAMTFDVYISLLAYLIGEGNSLSVLFAGTEAYALHFGIAFWVILSFMTYFGLKALRDGELIGVSLIGIMIIGIIVFLWNSINIQNLSQINLNFAMLPFGLILFAYLGFMTIPEASKLIKDEKAKLKRAIIYSYIITFIIYFLFALVVVGAKGISTPQIATLALGKIFIILGMLTMFTSYLALSIVLIDMYRFDFYMHKMKSWILTSLGPLILFILLTIIKKAEFVLVLTIGGAISGGLTAILILLMVKKAKLNGTRKPEYTIPHHPILTAILIIIFTIGIAFEIWHAFT